MPVIGQGTWKIEDEDQAVEAMRLGLELGLGHIDTAEGYPGAEELVRQAVGDRRDEVFLVSKVSPRNATYEGTLRHCEASLQRLGTDRLDVYLLHWPGRHALEETMNAMARLIDEGKIRMAGISNHDVEQTERAREALGGHPLACNQVYYHPGERGIEVELVPYCRRHQIAVVGYSPFGSGRFPGGKDGRDALSRIGAPHGKSPYQVILDCLTRQENVFLIPKAEDPDHVRQNAKALDTRLPKEAYDQFDRLFPVPEQVAGVPTI